MPDLKNTDLTDADIKRLESKDNGYTRERMNTLAENGFKGTDIRYLAGNGMSPHHANTLKNKGFSVDDIRTFADKGTDPRRAKQLLNEGFSTGDIRNFVDEGEDLNKISQLRWQEFSPEEIRHYVDHGDDAYSEGGATLDLVGRLKGQEIPNDHITHYVDRGVSLKLVSVLQERGWKPGTIKTTIQVIRNNKALSDYVISKYANVVSWCNAPHTPSDKGDTGDVCQSLPRDSSNTDKEENNTGDGENNALLGSRSDGFLLHTNVRYSY